MKGIKIGKLALLSLGVLLFLPLSCCRNLPENKDKPRPVADSTVAKNNFNYTGSSFKENYIWGGAMNLAWNELTDNLVHEKIRLRTNDALTLSTLKKLNNPVLTKADLDEASYYVKSGFGPQTQTLINRECRKKFPSKSFDDLNYDLGETDLISYAYFLKEVKYLVEFVKQDMRFKNKQVKGFRADDQSCENIYILDYQNEDKFLVGIKLQDRKDQIFVAKGYPMDQPDLLVAALRDKAPTQTSEEYYLGQVMDERDVFQAPVLKLEYERDYEEMLNKVIEQKIQNREYYIAVMKEKVKFDMDEKGARVENEGVIIGKATAMPHPSEYKPKIMRLDKPYWVMMKRFDSNNPYFILGVNNTELMKTAD